MCWKCVTPLKFRVKLLPTIIYYIYIYIYEEARSGSYEPSLIAGFLCRCFSWKKSRLYIYWSVACSVACRIRSLIHFILCIHFISKLWASWTLADRAAKWTPHPQPVAYCCVPVSESAFVHELCVVSTAQTLRMRSNLMSVISKEKLASGNLKIRSVTLGSTSDEILHLACAIFYADFIMLTWCWFLYDVVFVYLCAVFYLFLCLCAVLYLFVPLRTSLYLFVYVRYCIACLFMTGVVFTCYFAYSVVCICFCTALFCFFVYVRCYIYLFLCLQCCIYLFVYGIVLLVCLCPMLYLLVLLLTLLYVFVYVGCCIASLFMSGVIFICSFAYNVVFIYLYTLLYLFIFYVRCCIILFMYNVIFLYVIDRKSWSLVQWSCLLFARSRIPILAPKLAVVSEA
jgi:hypothetical protein